MLRTVSFGGNAFKNIKLPVPLVCLLSQWRQSGLSCRFCCQDGLRSSFSIQALALAVNSERIYAARHTFSPLTTYGNSGTCPTSDRYSHAVYPHTHLLHSFAGTPLLSRSALQMPLAAAASTKALRKHP